jgi:hypothetical protein
MTYEELLPLYAVFLHLNGVPPKLRMQLVKPIAQMPPSEEIDRESIDFLYLELAKAIQTTYGDALIRYDDLMLAVSDAVAARVLAEGNASALMSNDDSEYIRRAVSLTSEQEVVLSPVRALMSNEAKLHIYTMLARSVGIDPLIWMLPHQLRFNEFHTGVYFPSQMPGNERIGYLIQHGIREPYYADDTILIGDWELDHEGDYVFKRGGEWGFSAVYHEESEVIYVYQSEYYGFGYRGSIPANGVMEPLAARTIDLASIRARVLCYALPPDVALGVGGHYE